MKNTTIQAFVAIGIILLIVMIIGAYFLSTTPNKMQSDSTMSQNTTTPLSSAQSTVDMSTSTTVEGEVAGGFELSTAQVEALVSLGVDPDAVPSSISAEQEACFVEALGEERVGEIRAGAVPNALEFLRAQGCI